MTGTNHGEPLDAVIEEYVATYSDGWKPKTAIKYRAEFRDLLEWLVVTERPTTTASLDFATLYAYCNHLKQKPAVRGVWRGDRRAVPPAGATAMPRSLNSVNASMRSLRALVLYLFEDGRLSANPFARKHGRGGPNPLLPVAVTPTKGATLRDIEALERGCQGRTPADLRDQAIVALLKTTSARNSSIRLLRVEDVDLGRGVVTFWNAKMARTYETALQPEARAAVVRYLARGRPSFLPRYTVRTDDDGEPLIYVEVAADPLVIRVELASPDGPGVISATLQRWASEGFEQGVQSVPVAAPPGDEDEDGVLAGDEALVRYVATLLGFATDELMPAGRIGVLRAYRNFDSPRGILSDADTDAEAPADMPRLRPDPRIISLGAASGLSVNGGGRVPETGPSHTRPRGVRRGSSTLARVRSLLRQVSFDTQLGGLPTERSRAVASAVFEALPARERRVVMLHYGMFGESAKTVGETARQMNVSKERVRQLDRRGLTTLSRDPDVAHILSKRTDEDLADSEVTASDPVSSSRQRSTATPGRSRIVSLEEWRGRREGRR